MPDVKQVIASDMGLRNLYRNQILTALDDVRAELIYQRQRPPDELDTTELLELLKEAQAACGRWFGLIDAKDVEAAMDTVQKG